MLYLLAIAWQTGPEQMVCLVQHCIRERLFAGSLCLSAVYGTQVWQQPVHKPSSCPKAHAATSAGGPPPRTLPHSPSSLGRKAGHRDNANFENPWSCGRPELAARGATSYSCCGAMLWPFSGGSARHGCEVCCGIRRSTWSSHAATTAQVCANADGRVHRHAWGSAAMPAQLAFQPFYRWPDLQRNPPTMPSLAETFLIMSHTCPTGVHGRDCVVARLRTSQGSIAVLCCQHVNS